MHDAIVVGGGPGGLYGASKLAAAGYSVVLFEEHEVSGEPVHCTGILGDEVFAELDLPRTAILNPLPAARFHSPSGLDVSYRPASPEAMVIDRVAFDRALADIATRAGARVVEIGRQGRPLEALARAHASAFIVGSKARAGRKPRRLRATIVTCPLSSRTSGVSSIQSTMLLAISDVMFGSSISAW